jgi:hypothetical protein
MIAIVTFSTAMACLVGGAKSVSVTVKIKIK